MSPEQFLDDLLVHFGKRHASERAAEVWTRDMLGLVRGTDPRVLAAAYRLVVAEHDERAFPLPAQLRAFVSRACEQVYPEHRAGSDPIVDVPPPSPEARERVRALREMVSAALRARRVMEDEPPQAIDVSRTQRPGFERMMRTSPQRDRLFVDHAALARRITGERE
jgi:hypothetical protein